MARKKNDIEMYSVRNEGKSVVDGRFIRTLKNEIYKYRSSISKNVYIGKLDAIINKYNNTYHSKIKMKPVDVKSGIYIDFEKRNNKEDRKFKVDDHVRILKYKNFLQKGTLQIGLKKFLLLKKLKMLCLGYMLLVILTEKKSLERFTKKYSKKNQKEFRVKKLIKRKGDKLYVKWKGYDSSFNRWIDKKDIVIQN